MKTKRFIFISLAASLSLGLGLGGCMQPGLPAKPVLQAPMKFSEAPESSAAAPAPTPSEAWWTIFNDPRLNELETRGLVENQDLVAALARIDQARASARASRAFRWPRVEFDPKVQRSRSSGSNETALSITLPPSKTGDPEPTSATVTSSGKTLNHYELALQATYEVDLWGRVRHTLEADDAHVRLAEADARGVRLSLTTEIARAYFAWTSARARHALAESDLALARNEVEWMRARVASGLAARMVLSDAINRTAAAENAVTEVREEQEQARHGLVALCSLPAGGLPLSETGDLALPESPGLPAFFPAEVLRCRPDVAASQAGLDAAYAEVGVARAAFWPSLTFSATTGLEATVFERLFDSASRFGGGAIGLALPVLDGGRTRAAAAGARAGFAEASARFRSVVVGAIREVDDALSARRAIDQQAAQLQSALATAKEANEAADAIAAAGLGSRLAGLGAKRAANGLESQRLAARTASLQATLNLIKACGAWDHAPVQPMPPA